MPKEVKQTLTDKVMEECAKLELEGIALPTILQGTIGPEARALGAASLPLFNRYLLDQNVLFKELT